MIRLAVLIYVTGLLTFAYATIRLLLYDVAARRHPPLEVIDLYFEPDRNGTRI